MKNLARYIIVISVVSIFAGCFLFHAGKEEKLIAAAKKGDSEVLRVLLSQGVDVNAKDEHGRTALIYTALNGHTEAAKAIIAGRADVNLKDKEGSTALKAAAYSGYAEIVRDLLAKGADVNSKDNDGMTVLMYAAWNGHTEVVRDLLAGGAEVNARSNNGITALMLATDRNHEEIIEALKRAGAGTSAQGKVQESLESAIFQQGLTVKEFNDICMFYYTNPQPAKVIRVLKVFLSLDSLISDREKFGSMSHFFAAIAHKDKALYEKIFLLAKDSSGLPKRVLEAILQGADNFSSPQPDAPGGLDYLWSEFFATGDAASIRKIIDVLGRDNPDKDNPGAPVTETGRLVYAAQWSLESNVRNHVTVRTILEEEEAKAAEPIKSKLKTILVLNKTQK